MDDLITEFLAETNESLAELDTALVKLERNPDDQPTLSLIFRLVHTIKGTCGFLGLPRLERVAHAAENVLGRVRDRELAATPGVVTAVLAALDRIKLITAALAATGGEPEEDDSALIRMLDDAASGQAHAAAPAMTAAAAEAAPAEAHAVQQTIRVDVDVLEGLMTLVGELVLTRNQLLQLSRSQGASEFSPPLQRLSQITSDLQEGVMKTRMQPIGHAWSKLPRLVRDLAHETGKKITLEMLGQETELDRQVLDLVRDPLTHMVRNSGDHGLETPEERRAAGKPELGCIRLNAYHEGGQIIIDVSDDGRGLDVAKIRAKVVSQGLASEAELASMPDAQIRSFIFRPGFSTASAVTAISGRGVGMDVVRTNIERIGGTIDLDSQLGQGTRFTIKIPLTLAIVSALIVRSGPERFAIPQVNVSELVRVHRFRGAAGQPAIECVGATPVLRLRDQLLPLISLADLLQLDGAPPANEATVVVTAVGGRMLGILVDDVFDTEEIVVKPIAPILRHMTMFSGNTILGDGSVIMILDPAGVARAAGQSTSGGRDIKTASGAAVKQAAHSDQAVPLLLFRAGGVSTLRTVPLGLVARLEDLARDRIERSTSGLVTQYRGALMPLAAMAPDFDRGTPSQPVLVFNDGERSAGLIVDEIVDVVHERLRVQIGTEQPGLLGTAVVGGHAVDVVDTGYWLTLACRDWFGRSRQSHRRRILVVEDSTFFRNLLVPMLTTDGYDVTEATSAAEALALRDAGVMVDAIVSDIDMPGMNGFDFARSTRAGGAWKTLPMVALTSRDGPRDEAIGREAGFTAYCQKSEKDRVLAALRECLMGVAA